MNGKQQQDDAQLGCFWMGPGTLRIDRRAFHAPHRSAVLERLRAAVPEAERGIILLKGGDTLNVYSTDGEMLMRQDAYLHYLFGVNEDGFFGALDARTGKSHIFVPRLPAAYAVWLGEIKEPGYYAKKYAVDEAAYVDEMAEVLAAAAPPVLHLLAGTNTDSGLDIVPPAFDGIDRFKVETKALFPAITEARVHKSPGEVALMRYVNVLGSKAHVAMMQAAAQRPGVMEYQLESVFRDFTYQHGGSRHQGYTCIVASGANGAVLHYGHHSAPNDKQTRAGELLLSDCGCEYYRMGSDITCTWPVSGKFTPDQAAIYTAVLDAHTAVIAAIKPGVPWTDMHALAYEKILTGLQGAGFLAPEASVKAMVDADVGGLFMPHGLGHLIGIDTHDVGGYGRGLPPRVDRPGFKSLRTARALEERMMITVEPGCYFNAALLAPALDDPKLGAYLVRSRLEPLIGTFGGVRIEDNVLVTRDGALSLTDVPRTVGDVEAVMAGAPWPFVAGGKPTQPGDAPVNSIAGVPAVAGIEVV